MWDKLPLLSLLLASPLLGVLFLAVAPKGNGRLLQRMGMATSFLPLLFAGTAYVHYQGVVGTLQLAERYPWIRIPLERELLGASTYTLTFDYHLAADGLSLPLVFLTALVFAMASLASRQIKKRWKLFYIQLLLLETAVIGLLLARDLALFLLFLAFALVPMYFLVGIWGGADREKAASRFLVTAGMGVALIATAFLILIGTAGFTVEESTMAFRYSGDLDTIRMNLFTNPAAYVNYVDNPFTMTTGMRVSLFGLLVAGFGLLLPIVPFHRAAVRVQAEAASCISMIHSAVWMTMGAYGLLRFAFVLFPEQAKAAASSLAVLGLIGFLYGALVALAQRELRSFLAYANVSQMSLVLLGLTTFSTEGWTGAVLLLVSHGLISALLFLLIGSWGERAGSTELVRLAGLGSAYPFLTGVLLFASFAFAGLPGLAGFPGQLLIFIGIAKSHRGVAAAAVIGILLLAAVMLRTIQGLLFQKPREEHRGQGAGGGSRGDAALWEAVPIIVLTTLILLVGIYPGIVSQHVEKTIAGFTAHIQSSVEKGGD
ncbi:NADH-quinone oxidoreductase subunit M [Gorillibacterium sp. CAU 1737]|uniref:complex I subunit 4 family protein n=1 Tax=Gorillibacterium sp. CAU 1737 TaxID=3140362 RepID=UPI0032605A30